MDIQRISSNCSINDQGCWIWNRSKTSAGYGQLTEEGKYWTAHVYSFCCFNPKPKKGQVVRHSCHNRDCCNPEHLKIGSYKDNYNDSIDLYKKSDSRRRKKWEVNGVIYSTQRLAVKETGICVGTIQKYTIDGVFDIDGYRSACKIAGWNPKV